ncbi:MAG: trehalose-phosphatase [Sulfobacillus benefaciens]|uniref:Trehalose 6-phosphate phosphatase n=1 Tax=Sulfobacillus benefaciens TaxID=453960 RepID=A0A2T2XAJ0_9FIRM|nr:MAG: trehalose-phosphatase [Sulfobacillus benefaciens]
MSEQFLTLATLGALSQQVRAQSWLWFLDIDGTLLDIAPSPSAVEVPDDLSVSLDRLADNPCHHVALISGRSLADISRLFPSPLLSKSGNHGAEYFWNQKSWLHSSSQRFLAIRPQLLEAVAPLTQQFPGLFIEDKRYSISVHYRHVSPSLHPTLGNRINTLLSSLNDVVIYPAKLCWEIRPNPGPTKGDAVRTLYAKISPQLLSPIFPIIIGDDRTDEDAFGAISPALTIHVGDGTTQARYRLSSPRHVRELVAAVSRDPHLAGNADHAHGDTV